MDERAGVSFYALDYQGKGMVTKLSKSCLQIADEHEVECCIDASAMGKGFSEKPGRGRLM